MPVDTNVGCVFLNNSEQQAAVARDSGVVHAIERTKQLRQRLDRNARTVVPDGQDRRIGARRQRERDDDLFRVGGTVNRVPHDVLDRAVEELRIPLDVHVRGPGVLEAVRRAMGLVVGHAAELERDHDRRALALERDLAAMEPSRSLQLEGDEGEQSFTLDLKDDRTVGRQPIQRRSQLLKIRDRPTIDRVDDVAG
jgi:hypothetical protein